MEQIPFENVPDHLFKQVMSQHETISNLWQISLKLIDKGFEVISNTFSLLEPKQELIAFRDSQYNKEKITFTRDNLSLSLIPTSHNQFLLHITFQSSLPILQPVMLYIQKGDDYRLIASLTPKDNQVQLEELSIADYKIIIEDKELQLNITNDSFKNLV